MSYNLAQEAKKAIDAGAELQNYYRRMQQETTDPKVRAILHDLLLMEEMNEVLLRSLNNNLTV